MISSQQLKDRWGQLWSKQMTIEEIMFRRKDEHSDLELKGVSMLINLHRYAKTNPSIPIAVDYNYEVNIGDCQLAGTLELVRETKASGEGRIIEITDFRTAEYSPDQFTLNHDMRLTAQSYAFRQLFKVEEDRLNYYLLKKGKQHFTQRDDNEFNKLTTIVNQVADDMSKQVVYPRYSLNCKQCQYQYECNKYQGGQNV
jgi:CRISPR/Cas system-associated exonuclease Cas4 (RecB family)